MNTQTTETRNDLSTDNGTTELEMQIKCRLGAQIRHFRLVFMDHGVILRGHAQTYYAKQLAQHAVMEATRLRILANEIEVC
jgi:hypothetical protein